jgi:glycosyltransferase involved in cell wall biosynthesis
VQFHNVVTVDLNDPSANPTRAMVAATVIWTAGFWVVGSTVHEHFSSVSDAKRHFAKELDHIQEVDRLRKSQNKRSLLSTSEEVDSNLFWVARSPGCIALPGAVHLLATLLNDDPYAAVAVGNWIADSPPLHDQNNERDSSGHLSVLQAGFEGPVPSLGLHTSEITTFFGKSIVVVRRSAISAPSGSKNNAFSGSIPTELIQQTLLSGWRAIRTSGTLTVCGTETKTSPISGLEAPQFAPPSKSNGGIIQSHRRGRRREIFVLDISQLWEPQLKTSCTPTEVVIHPHVGLRFLPPIQLAYGTPCFPALEDELAAKTLNFEGRVLAPVAITSAAHASLIRSVVVRSTGPIPESKRQKWAVALDHAFALSQVGWQFLGDETDQTASDSEPTSLTIWVDPATVPSAVWLQSLVLHFERAETTRQVVCPAVAKTISGEAGGLFASLLEKATELARGGLNRVAVLSFVTTNLAYRNNAIAVRGVNEVDAPNEANANFSNILRRIDFANGTTVGSCQVVIEEKNSFRLVRKHLQIVGSTFAGLSDDQVSIRSVTMFALTLARVLRRTEGARALIAAVSIVSGFVNAESRKSNKAKKVTPPKRKPLRPGSAGLPQSVAVVGARYAHHSSMSGYERNFESFGAKTLNTPVRWRSGQHWDRFERVLRNLSDNPIYSSGAFATELRCAISMVCHPRVLRHEIYGETDGWVLPALGRWRPFSATVHLPPLQFELLGISLDRFRFAQTLVVVDPSLLEYVTKKLPGVKVALVEIGVDTEYFHRRTEVECEPPARFVHCVGSHFRDFETLFRAWCSAKAAMTKPLELHLIGAPNEIAEYVQKLRLVDVIIRPRLSDTELRDAYWESTALVLPLSDATANTALLEAHACGTPIITTDLVGPRHYLGDAAFYLPKGDVAAWKSCFEQLSKETDLAAGPPSTTEFSFPAVSDRLHDTLLPWRDR